MKEPVPPEVKEPPSKENPIGPDVDAEIPTLGVGQAPLAETMDSLTENRIWDYPPLPSSPVLPSFSEFHVHVSPKGDEYRTEKQKVIQVSVRLAWGFLNKTGANFFSRERIMVLLLPSCWITSQKRICKRLEATLRVITTHLKILLAKGCVIFEPHWIS